MRLRLLAFLLFLCGPWSWAADRSSPSAPLRMRLLERTMAGRGVLAVSAGEEDGEDTHPETAFRAGDTLLTRLQAVAASASSDRLTLIPFRVGEAWVLAPETQEAPNLDPKALKPAGNEPLAVVIDRALLALSGEQARRLGDEDGLAVRELPAAAREWLEQAFAPPMRIVDRAREEDESKRGGAFIGKVVATLSKPVDWEHTRLRAELVTDYANDSLPDEEFTVLWGRRRPARREFRLAPGSEISRIENEPRYYVSVPNRLKPSDLETAPFTQPIGLSGIQPLPKVLERLSTVTGLKLSCGVYRGATVYLGSRALRCGDVLDGLRLALTAAWRRLGETYILAWDRDGPMARRSDSRTTGRRPPPAWFRPHSAIRSRSGWRSSARRVAIPWTYCRSSCPPCRRRCCGYGARTWRLSACHRRPRTRAPPWSPGCWIRPAP